MYSGVPSDSPVLVMVSSPRPCRRASPKSLSLVISDFGLARRHGLGEETITSTGESLGTPLYMAPEQVHSGVEPISPATDLYALGIVMYELVLSLIHISEP